MTLETHHHFRDGSCTKENVEIVRKSDAETIFITVNCEPLDPSIFLLQHTQLTKLQTIKEECLISYLCGAAAIHQAKVVRDGLNIARRLVMKDQANRCHKMFRADLHSLYSVYKEFRWGD